MPKVPPPKAPKEWINSHKEDMLNIKNKPEDLLPIKNKKSNVITIQMPANAAIIDINQGSSDDDR